MIAKKHDRIIRSYIEHFFSEGMLPLALCKLESNPNKNLAVRDRSRHPVLTQAEKIHTLYSSNQGHGMRDTGR